MYLFSRTWNWRYCSGPISPNKTLVCLKIIECNLLWDIYYCFCCWCFSLVGFFFFFQFNTLRSNLERLRNGMDKQLSPLSLQLCRLKKNQFGHVIFLLKMYLCWSFSNMSTRYWKSLLYVLVVKHWDPLKIGQLILIWLIVQLQKKKMLAKTVHQKRSKKVDVCSCLPKNKCWTNK